MKKILSTISFIAASAAAAAMATGHSGRQDQVDRMVNKYTMPFPSGSGPYGDKAFKRAFQNNSPYYSIVMDEGAIKAFTGFQIDGTALSGTAGEFNILYLGSEALIHSPTISGGTSLPVMAATGLDLTNGNTQDDDVDELVGGILGASGRPLVVGTDPASKFCVKAALNDVSASDQFAMGWRMANSTRTSGSVPYGPGGNLDSTYTDYATIGLLSGAVTTWTAVSPDAVIATDMAAITDLADSAGFKEYCVLVSAAGAVTYTYEGSAPADAVAYTFADGRHIVPFLFYLQNADSDGANDPLIASWEVSFQ